MRNSTSEEILSQASALNWSTEGPTMVIAGATPDSDAETALSVMRRASRNHNLDLLTGIHGAMMFAVLSGPGLDPEVTPRLITPYFGPGAVVVSDVVSGLSGIGAAARACASGVRAAQSWTTAPRPVHAAELLPERGILGEKEARTELIERVYQPLAADPVLLDTAVAYLDNSQSLEATGRALFVHSNTIRYRIKRITEITGYDITHAREAFAIRVSIIYGRTDT
jgi:hypothetical protein